MTLVEKYAKRINLAEKYHAKMNEGSTMKPSSKIGLAQVLENTVKLFEAFEQSVSAQRADMGDFKRFALDITTLVDANLLAPELVLIHEMTSFTGVLVYTEYVYGSNKGDVAVGDLISNPFKLTNAHPNYTSGLVDENVTIAAEGTEVALKWGPVVPGSIAFQIGDDKYFDAAGKLYKGEYASRRLVYSQEDAEGRLEGVAGHYEVEVGSAVEVGTVTYGFARSAAQSGPIYDKETPKITFTTTPAAEAAVTTRIDYLYNNVAIMQNDIPTLVPRNKAITLQAKARRIAINYSNIAAFQQKLEYGRDMAKELEQKAVHQLKWEIDTEIVNFLVKNAGAPVGAFNVVPRTGLSLSQQYEGFGAYVDELKTVMYNKTQKFQPNYMICARDVITVLNFVNGWKPASVKGIAGPYRAGELNELKVFVHPAMAAGTFILGLNDGDFNTSAAVYAPFMTIVPTALLETPDGANSKGWSTVYALELLNKDLLIAGKIEKDPSATIFSGDIVRVQA